MILNSPVKSTATAYYTESKAFLADFRRTRKVTTRLPQIGEKQAIFNTLVGLTAIQLRNSG